MYEKTIAGEDRIYEITIPETPTLIYDLLSEGDKADYDNLINVGIEVQPLVNPSYNADKKRYRTPVDGYIVNVNSNFHVATSQSGASDLALKDLQYTFPVYFWLNKHWVYSDTANAAIIRIFFS